METLTLEGVLKAIHTQSQEFRNDLRESQKKFDLRLEREAEEREKREKERKKLIKNLKKKCIELEKKLPA